MNETDVVVKIEEQAAGDKGLLGVASPSLTINQMWHNKCHKRVDANDRHNHRKKTWKRLPKTPSLKRFARELAATGDATAKAWLASKLGKNNEKRSDKNIARVALERQASKAARKGTGKK